MNPRRLSEIDDDFDTGLIRAAKGERPPRDGKKKALAAIALVGVGLGWRTRAWWKWTAAAAVAGTALTLWLATRPATVRAPDDWTASTTSPFSAAPVVVTPPSAASSAGAVVPDAGDGRDVLHAPRRGAPSTPDSTAHGLPAPLPSASPPHEAAPTEIALLSDAKALLKQHDAVAARAVLNRYAALYPHGVLSEEADVLHIDTLLAAGARDEAAKAAARFLDRYPHSAYAQRMESLLH